MGRNRWEVGDGIEEVGSVESALEDLELSADFVGRVLVLEIMWVR